MISRLLLIAQHGKNCDLCPGSVKPEEQSDSRLLGEVPSSIFIFYESLISPVGDSNNYSKLVPPEERKEKNRPLRIQLKIKGNFVCGYQGAFPEQTGCRPAQIKHYSQVTVPCGAAASAAPGGVAHEGRGLAVLPSPQTSFLTLLLSPLGPASCGAGFRQKCALHFLVSSMEPSTKLAGRVEWTERYMCLCL